jgi:predicted nucleic acid-binding protein
MVKVLLDTNIVIDVLNGVPEAQEVLDSYPERSISIITWIEVMVGAPADLGEATRAFLKGFEVVGLTQDVADQAVIVRQNHKLKLPDAIIWAAAKATGLRLLTRDTKGFPRQHPDITVPYEL